MILLRQRLLVLRILRLIPIKESVERQLNLVRLLATDNCEIPQPDKTNFTSLGIL